MATLLVEKVFKLFKIAVQNSKICHPFSESDYKTVNIIGKDYTS